ncbi:MAG: TIGR03663 family protein, partial [Bdellovibrio sp.]|nr:TIGR03663 family protein [Bdellovibrio sp.]
LVGMALAFVGLVSKEGRLRMISAFSLFQFLVYSLIPYKTVWCILTLVWGFYFVLAIYVEKLWSNKNWKFWGLMVVILLGGIADVRSAWLAVYREPIDLEHPYVYVNSTYDLKEFQAMIDQAVKAHPELLQEPIQIGMKEQWPFPWTMRMFEKPRYDLCHKSVAADAWLYMCDPANETGVEKHLNGSYMRIYIKFRQSRETSLVYVRKNLFDQIYHGQYDVVGSEGEKK